MKQMKRLWIVLCVIGIFFKGVTTVNAQEINPFGDVKTNVWYYSYALYAYENGIMNGKGNDNNGLIIFDPSASITRAEFVQILYNREGKPDVEITKAFNDVKDDAWYAKAISWAAENNIVAGKGEIFDVNSPITRQEMITVLYKYASNFLGYDTEGRAKLETFVDEGQIADWATDCMEWAVYYKVMKGKGDKLAPSESTTRAESVTMLKNFIDTYVGEIFYSKPSKEHVLLDENSNRYFVDNQILITVVDEATKEEIETIVSKLGGVIVGCIEVTGDYQVEFAKAYDKAELDNIIQSLKSNPAITEAYRNELFEVTYEAIPNDTKWLSQEWSAEYPEGINWGVEAIDTMEAWDYYNLMSTVNVGVIDGAFDKKHKDLDFQKVWNNASVLGSEYYAHGTHVAGIIAAKYNNNQGVAGVAPKANLYAYSILENHTDKVGKKIYLMGMMEWKYALANLITANCKVINVSMSKSDEIEIQSEILGTFLSKLLKEGYDFVIVQSAGNESRLATTAGLFTGITLPEVKDRIIVVGAIGMRDSYYIDGNKVFGGYYFAEFSNYGERVDVVAPGVKIYSTLPNNEYGNQRWDVQLETMKDISGTSMAAPHVSGIAAMCFSVNPALTGKQVKEIIVQTASSTVKDTSLGHSRKDYKVVDAGAAVKQALSIEGDMKVPMAPSEVMVMGNIAGYDINGKLVGLENVCMSVYSILDSENEMSMTYNYSTQTDVEGNYELFLVPGKYSISVYKEGYLPQAIINVVVTEEPITYVEQTILDVQVFNNHYYKVYSGRYTWTEAKTKCEEMGGYLATITSLEEQTFIESINNQRKWIGGYRDDDYNWYWVTGEVWDYTNWASGEPNNSSNVISNERYAAVWPKQWNDLANTNRSEQNGFICEWDAIK